MADRVALVTGASRGIGKGAAIKLAEAGFKVAIAARTVHEGDGWDLTDPPRPLKGSLDTTAAEIVAAGGEVFPVRVDLLDRTSLGTAVERIMAKWGRIDTLVNNAVHAEGDHNASFVDISVRTIDDEVQANTVAPLLLAKLVLPVMLRQGQGTIINVSSGAGYRSAPLKPKQGGWSTMYSVCKGGLHRLAGQIAVELGDQGINAFNLTPGFVYTERMEQRHEGADSDDWKSPWVGAPPAALGASIAWLAANYEEARQYNGKTVVGQLFALERDLYPNWLKPGQKVPNVGPEVSVWGDEWLQGTTPAR